MRTTTPNALPIPVKMTLSFLITANAIRNRRNSNKTKNSDGF
jgi:hypothetical protein